MYELKQTPRQIVSELDEYIVGQHAAKKSVAVALRNRYRRLQLDEKNATRYYTKKYADDRTYRGR